MWPFRWRNFSAHSWTTNAVNRSAAYNVRHPHRVFQWIAPCINGQLPDQTMFYPVKCIDISRTGIAFFTEEALTTDQVIVALGTTEEAFYVRSRVANCAGARRGRLAFSSWLRIRSSAMGVKRERSSRRSRPKQRAQFFFIALDQADSRVLFDTAERARYIPLWFHRALVVGRFASGRRTGNSGAFCPTGTEQFRDGPARCDRVVER